MSVWWTNRFWSMSLEHIVFLDFLKLFVNMCLAISFAGKKKTHFLDLWIKSYACLKFQGEVWAGRACAGANEEDLTTLRKFWEQGGWAGGQGVTILGTRAGTVAYCAPTSGRLAGDLATMARSGRPLAAGRRLHRQVWRFFFFFFYSFKFYFFKGLACNKGLGFLGGGGLVYNTPFFEECPYTWKC
jgi:hypothetical protein